jgi:hypothetical protein
MVRLLLLAGVVVSTLGNGSCGTSVGIGLSVPVSGSGWGSGYSGVYAPGGPVWP